MIIDWPGAISKIHSGKYCTSRWEWIFCGALLQCQNVHNNVLNGILKWDSLLIQQESHVISPIHCCTCVIIIQVAVAWWLSSFCSFWLLIMILLLINALVSTIFLKNSGLSNQSWSSHMFKNHIVFSNNVFVILNGMHSCNTFAGCACLLVCVGVINSNQRIATHKYTRI